MPTMPTDTLWLWLGMFVWCSGYAYLLSRPPVRTWYHEHNATALTVVIGNTFIVAGMFIAALVELIPLEAALLHLALEIAAGLPILLWQGADRIRQYTQRRSHRGRQVQPAAKDGRMG